MLQYYGPPPQVHAAPVIPPQVPPQYQPQVAPIAPIKQEQPAEDLDPMDIQSQPENTLVGNTPLELMVTIPPMTDPVLVIHIE